MENYGPGLEPSDLLLICDPFETYDKTNIDPSIKPCKPQGLPPTIK